ncbi:hypothetical protein ZTR_03660 [Talaromyces verruculosus]|nr:hypothetical protein ZTR_03660 [Talaromyces verruculosus]
MSGSESMSANSPDSGLLNARPYVALGFHRTFVDPVTGRVTRDENYITREKGADPANPLGIPPGIYQMVLHLDHDTPTDDLMPDGTTERKYQCKNWHFELGNEKANPGNNLVDIQVIFGTGSPSDSQQRYSAKPSEGSFVALGTVELKSMQSFEVMLVGNVHHLFLDGEILVLKKFVGNPRYYIQVNDR